MCFAPQRPTYVRHINYQKWSGNGCALYILTLKCASRHNGVLILDITTSKGPGMVCFVHFDLEMCLAPQRHTLFWHLNFQKCCERGVSLAFLLPNVLRTTTACNFSSLICPGGSAPAAWASLLSPLRSSKSFRKHRESRLPYLFAHLPLLSCLSLSFLIFSLLLFSSLTLPTSAFPSVHIVESLTSKLPLTKPSRSSDFWQGAQSLAPAAQNNIWTFKSAPRPSAFHAFGSKMCLAPQRRAPFRHVNFQEWSENCLLNVFWLGNVLCATTACNFPSLIWPGSSAPAALASLLFDPPETETIGKTRWVATFLPCRAPASSFSPFLFSDFLSSSLLLSDSSHLCFPSVHTSSTARGGGGSFRIGNL